MFTFPPCVAARLLAAVLFLSSASWLSLLAQTSHSQASIERLKVLENKGAVEIHVQSSDPIVPRTQMLTRPDRLVMDFLNAVPRSELHSQSVNRGVVKNIRIGLLQSTPPITRVVLDLKAAQSFRVSPKGRVIVIAANNGAWEEEAAQVSRTRAVEQVRFLDNNGAFELEVESSHQIVPRTQILTRPDRLVMDFPDAVPDSRLRSQSVDRGQVKDIRIGLFQSSPPITRIVLDFKTAQSYEVLPEGRKVMIKIMRNAPVKEAAGLDNPVEPAVRPVLLRAIHTNAQRMNDSGAPEPPEVSFRDGVLAIKANKATLSDVLLAVQQQTGADITIPTGAELERVVVNLGPGPARDVLAHLLNGSKFNFLITNPAKDPRQLDRVILSPRAESANMVLVQPARRDDTDHTVSTISPVQPNPAEPQPAASLRPRPEIAAEDDQDPE